MRTTTNGAVRRSDDEFRLLLCGSRSRISARGREQIQELLTRGLDWNRLLDLAERNAVFPSLHNALNDQADVPAGVRQQLKQNCTRCVAHNLRLARELVRIMSLLQGQEIPARAYKGPALALLAYGSLDLRQVGDLDILVRRSDLKRAQAVLEKAGYHLALTPQEEARYLSQHYHLYFRGGDPPIPVEIHWSFTPACWQFPLSEERIWDSATFVSLAGYQVPTCDPELSLLALCAHGTKERWARLSMICDVAELVQSRPALDWDWIFMEARRIRRVRVLLLGLALAHQLLELQLSPQVLDQIERDRSLQSLCNLIEENLRSASVLHGTRLHCYALRIWDHTEDRTGYLAKVLGSLPKKFLGLAKPSPADTSFISLRPPFSFLYYLVRPVRAIARYRGLRRILSIISDHL